MEIIFLSNQMIDLKECNAYASLKCWKAHHMLKRFIQWKSYKNQQKRLKSHFITSLILKKYKLTLLYTFNQWQWQQKEEEEQHQKEEEEEEKEDKEEKEEDKEEDKEEQQQVIKKLSDENQQLLNDCQQLYFKYTQKNVIINYTQDKDEILKKILVFIDKL